MHIIKSDLATDGKRKRRRKAITDCDSVQIAVALPKEIITVILARLPVKSLLQFRCVCKSWRFLISDPTFAKTHLKASTQIEDYAHHGLVMSSACRHSYVKSSSLSSVFNHERTLVTHSLNYSLNDPKPFVRIVGSVNGLVCIVIDDVRVYLWNPTTRKSRKLPNFGIRQRPCRYVYGFGYDEGNSEYKVFVTYCSKIHFPNPVVKIYGLKSKSWRIGGNFPKDIVPLHPSGKFVSGSLHWPASNEEMMVKNIISLDVSKETFSEFSQPCYGEVNTDNFLTVLGVLSGCLCLMGNISGSQSDVWVMKEYGKVESWSKVFSISYAYLNEPQYSFRYSAPLVVSKNNEVVVLLGSRLASYNIANKTIWYPDIRNCFEIETYVESLVSVYPE